MVTPLFFIFVLHGSNIFLSVILVFEKLKELFPSLNKRRITWRMVKRACNKLGALLFNIPLGLDGYFVPASLSDSGKPEIYINSKMSENLQIATAVHEVKHAAFDQPIGAILLSRRHEWTTAARREHALMNRYEFEACAMGAIALITEKQLRHASLGLFSEEDEFMSAIWCIRLIFCGIYGI